MHTAFLKARKSTIRRQTADSDPLSRSVRAGPYRYACRLRAHQPESGEPHRWFCAAQQPAIALNNSPTANRLRPDHQPSCRPHHVNKSISPPSAATAASRACCCPPRCPASAEYPSRASARTSSRSRPDTCPSPPFPARCSCAGNG